MRVREFVHVCRTSRSCEKRPLSLFFFAGSAERGAVAFKRRSNHSLATLREPEKINDLEESTKVEEERTIAEVLTGGDRDTVHRGYNPMVRVVWLNTSPRRRPRAVRPEGGVEGWCPAIPRGPLGCILLTNIMREKECFCGR